MLYIVLSSAYLSSVLLSLGINKISFEKHKSMLKKDGYIYINDNTFKEELKKYYPLSLITFLPITNLLVSCLILNNLDKDYDSDVEYLLEKEIIKYVDDKDNGKKIKFKNKRKNK